MQQNNQVIEKQSSQPAVPHEVLSLINYLKSKQAFIQKDLVPLLTDKQSGLGHSNYSVKSLKNRKGKPPNQTQFGVFYDIRSKLQTRIQGFKKVQAKHQLLLTSDLLIWSIPNFCSTYMGMMNYIKKWKIQSLPLQSTIQKSERIEFCKKLISTKDQKNLYMDLLQNNEILEINLLKVPLLIISEYFEKWDEIKKYYSKKEQQFKKDLIQITKDLDENDNQNQELKLLKVLLSRSKLQIMEVQNRIKQAEKYIQDIQTVQSLDPEVYKNRLILTQFKTPLNLKDKVLYRFGKRLKFFYILKKRCLKAQKRLKQRKDSVFQLVDKQKFYIDVLSEYILYIKHPIQNLKILTEDQNRLLFCNIQEIKGFHQILYQQLAKRYQEDSKYQTYGDIMKKNIPFLKLYVDYIYIAENAQNFLIKLIRQNEAVKTICDKYFMQKHKTASNQLMQPTFKIARYQMLFDEILKRTNPSTSDHKFFTEAKQLFKQNLTQVNATVDKIIRRNKLNQLQQEFGTADQPIFVKQNCQYLNQFNIQMVYHEKRLNVILFAFTDLILIAEQNTRKKLKYIRVDEKFYVKRQDDSKVYRNIIKIHSKEGFLTFSTGNYEKNLKKADELFEVLKGIQKTTQSNQLVYVQVLGTQQIGSTSFAKYTEYIIQIKYLALKKLLHLRFSEIANIVKVMQHFYKDLLGITDQQTLKKTWFNNHKSKTIEDRKRTIQQILQKLFNHQLIKKQPKFLLNYLGLPENFFEIAKKIYTQKNTSQILMTSYLKVMDKMQGNLGSGKSLNFEQSGTFTVSQRPSLSLLKKESYLSKRQLKEAITLLCATQIKLGRDIYHDLDQKLQGLKQKAQKIDIYINTMKQDQTIMVKVTQFDTVEDVCNKVSKLMGLRSNRDFRLFHEIGKKQLRVLEHQQLILKLFTFPKPKQQSLANNVSSIFQSVTSSLKKIVSPQTHPTLIFKKYYFLPFDIQSRQCKKDLTRLRLLTYQIFSEVKDMKYQLNVDEYLLFAALLIYIQMDGQIEKHKIEEDIIHKIIPETIFKLKNYTQGQWLAKIQPHLIKFQQEIKKVIQYNQEQLKYNKIKTDIPSKMALHFGHRHLASQIVLNKIKSNPIYGSNLFYVQPYKKTYEQLKSQSLKMAYNMWLAIKVNSLSLLTPSSKQSQFELKYTQIQKINVYSEAIVFKTDDYTSKQYRLNTYQSFEISQLVKYYKALNEILKQLGQDEKLANQAKKYRNQIQQYRSTYEVHDDDVQINMKMH